MQPREELEALYLEHHRAVGSSEKTLTHYYNTFLIFHRFLAHAGQEQTADVLVSAIFNAFAAYLRETPTYGIRGENRRGVVITHGHLTDLRAFFRWLSEEKYLDNVPKVPMPKSPQTLFLLLTESDF